NPTRIQGAATPICSYVGSKPTQNVGTPISASVTRNVFFRPSRSPKNPKTIAPKGLTAKPAANASKARTNAVVSLTCEKKFRLITTANAPYRKKSNHSNTEATEEAAM